MESILSKPYVKYPLLALYVAVMGFATGIGMLWGLPMVGFAPGPFLSYGLGLLLSGIVVYLVFFRWHAPRRAKLLAAVLVLIVLASAGLLVAGQGIVEGRKRLIELLGD